MMRSLRILLIPVIPVILLCIAIVFGGGSHPDQISHLALQLGASLVICAALWPAVKNNWTGGMFTLVGLVCIFAIWSLLQMVPLSASFWQSLPGRSIVLEGATLLGADKDAIMPISLTPTNGFSDLLGLLPPIAIFLTLAAIGLRRGTKYLLWAITLIGAACSALGLLQILMSSRELYFYSFTNFGSPVGFFANVNHQATLLLMCIPFCAALIGSIRRNWTGEDADVGQLIFCGACFLVMITGLFAAGSVAGYTLLVPTLIFSFLLIGQESGGTQSRILVYVILFLTVIGTGTLVAFSPVLDGLGATSFEDTTVSRRGIWATSMQALDEHGLLGSGLGSYTEVYRLYEDPDAVTSTFVRFAHNDYLQTVIELGLVGFALMGAIVLLWLWLFITAFSSKTDQHTRLKKAALIAILVVLLHSMVDYPGRTPAILCFVTLCFSVLTLPERSRKRASKEEEQLGSHLTI